MSVSVRRVHVVFLTAGIKALCVRVYGFYGAYNCYGIVRQVSGFSTVSNASSKLRSSRRTPVQYFRSTAHCISTANKIRAFNLREKRDK